MLCLVCDDDPNQNRTEFFYFQGFLLFWATLKTLLHWVEASDEFYCLGQPNGTHLNGGVVINKLKVASGGFFKSFSLLPGSKNQLLKFEICLKEQETSRDSAFGGIFWLSRCFQCHCWHVYRKIWHKNSPKMPHKPSFLQKLTLQPYQLISSHFSRFFVDLGQDSFIVDRKIGRTGENSLNKTSFWRFWSNIIGSRPSMGRNGTKIIRKWLKKFKNASEWN